MSSSRRRAKSGRALSWVKSPADTRGTDHHLSFVGHGLSGQEPDQVRLAGAVGADDPDALAEVDLLGERADQAVDRDPAQVEHAARGVAAAQANRDLLVAHGVGGRAVVDPALPARLRGVGALGPAVGVAGALLEDPHAITQALLLLTPAGAAVAHQLLAMSAGLGVGRVGAAVHPGAGALESDDGIAGRREQLTVVGDHQDRLARRADQRLELTLGRDVEEVVGLVEEQHLSVGGEQQLEHQALALSAGQRGRGPVAHFVEPGARDAPAGRVPLAFKLVPP